MTKAKSHVVFEQILGIYGKLKVTGSFIYSIQSGNFGFGCIIVLIVVQAGNSKVLVQKSNSQFSKTKVNTEPKKMYVEIYNNDIYVGNPFKEACIFIVIF